MIRVWLPEHLRNLARAPAEVELDLAGEVSLSDVLDQLEARYPVLRGTIRDHQTRKRRAFIRFFACGQDITHDPPEAPLPAAVRSGGEPLLVIGALAGG